MNPRLRTQARRPANDVRPASAQQIEYFTGQLTGGGALEGNFGLHQEDTSPGGDIDRENLSIAREAVQRTSIRDQAPDAAESDAAHDTRGPARQIHARQEIVVDSTIIDDA